MRMAELAAHGEEGPEEEITKRGPMVTALAPGKAAKTTTTTTPGTAAYERLARMASGNAVVVFSVSGCCMCHVVKRLLLGLGVGPAVYELDQMEKGRGREIHAVLSHLLGVDDSSSSPAAAAVVPAVFVGGKLLGGVETVMSYHVNGSLVPLLKQAGGLWL